MPNFFNKLLYSGGLGNQLNVSDFPSRYISIIYVTSYETRYCLLNFKKKALKQYSLDIISYSKNTYNSVRKIWLIHIHTHICNVR